MKNNVIIIVLLVFLGTTLIGQNVAINTDGSTANSDAILHLKSTSKGLVIPSMTSGQRTSISNVSNGLLVYDTQTNSFWYRDAGTWNELLAGDIDLAVIEDDDGDTKIQVEEGNDDDAIRFDLKGSEKLVLKENATGDIMLDVQSSNFNTFIGRNAGLSNEPSTPTGRLNTFIGYDAGRSNETGIYNTFLGANAGRNVAEGARNLYLGVDAGEVNSEGDNNVVLGTFAYGSGTAGNNNTLIGYAVASQKTAGNNNVFIGYEAGKSSSTGSNNIYIGNQAGFSATGSNELFIENSGSNSPLIYGNFSSNLLRNNGTFYINSTSSSSDGGQLFFENQEANKYSLGYYTSTDYLCLKDEVNNDRMMYFKNGLVGIQRVPTTNDLEVGGTASKSTAGDWLANSDARLKKNIHPMSSEAVLQKILQLKGVTYEWDDDKTGNERPKGVQYGFTAQNIQEVYPELVTTDNLGYLQTAYGTYDAMYIESIRALLNRIEDLETKLGKLEGLEARLNNLELANGLSSSK